MTAEDDELLLREIQAKHYWMERAIRAERALSALDRVRRRQHVPKIIHDIINKWSQDSH